MPYNLQESVEKVCRKATASRTHELPYLTLELAKEVRKQNLLFIVTASGASKYSVELVNTADKSKVSVELSNSMACGGVISRTAFAKTMYGNVFDDEMFKVLYDVKDRFLDYVDNGVMTKKSVQSAPCMMCGLVLPTRNLTIDHQRPQSGGELEAIVKTFRACGLTREGPKGAKGQAVLKHMTQGAALAPALPQLGRAPAGGGSLQDRYTLNDVGTILYSFVSDAGDMDKLKSNCMHGLLNLKPLCQTCNSFRGNPTKSF